MVVVAHVDVLGALIAHLRSFSELTTLVGGATPRISGTLQDAWPLPAGAILLRKAGGPPDPILTAGRRSTRIDAFFFGTNGYAADRVWAMADAILVPKQGERRASIVRTVGGGEVRIDDIVPESDAVSESYPGTDWPCVFASYVVRWWASP